MAYRKPRNIDEVLSGQLQSRVITADIPVPPGVTIYVTDSSNGRYRRSIKTVTVPVWAYNHTHKKTDYDAEYAIYYVAHELAHAWVHAEEEDDDSPHGARFYKWFKKLCPPHLWHYEIEYKPRDAKRAGISPNVNDNIAAAVGGCPVKERYPLPLAAGPTPGDLADLRALAVSRDPQIKKYLTDIPDRDVRGYINGWFKQPSKA